MNPLSFSPMPSYHPEVSSADGGVPDLPQEFLTEGENMCYDVLYDEGGGGAQKSLTRRELIENDLKPLPFQRYDSEHFELMYLPNSEAERDIEYIAERREYARSQLCSLFAADPADKHRIYIFENDIQSYCPTWGKTFASRAIPEGLLAGIIYSSDPDSYEQNNFGHELTHLFEYFYLPFMMRVPPYLREGMADFMSMSGKNKHLRYVKFLKAGLVSQPFTFDEYKLNTAEYMESASFIEYISEVFGIGPLMDLYAASAVLQENEIMPTEKFAQIIQTSLGSSLEDIMKSYYSYICSLWECENPQTPPEEQEEIINIIRMSAELATKEDYENILNLYSSDFYYRTQQQDKDVSYTHICAFSNAAVGNFSFFPLDSWLYGKSCAVKASVDRYGQQENRIFLMEKLNGSWRFSPKYPGGKSD